MACGEPTITNKTGRIKIWTGFGREPWSSGYGKRLTFRRLWVRIPAPYTGWTFFTYICCKGCNDVCLRGPKINEKEAGVGPFLKKKDLDSQGHNIFFIRIFCAHGLGKWCCCLLVN